MKLAVANQREALGAIEALASAVRTEGADLEPVLAQYERSRRTLMRVFQEAALADLDLVKFDLNELVAAITMRMREVFGDVLPSDQLVVTGLQSVHRPLYAYLAARVGEAVPAWRLRVLTAEQKETERRVRELRDLGLDVHAVAETFTLRSLEADVDAGVVWAVEKRLETRKALRSGEVDRRLRQLRGEVT